MEATCVYNTATKKSVGPNNRNQGLEAPFPFGLPKLLDPTRTLPALGFGPVPDSSDCKWYRWYTKRNIVSIKDSI